MPPRSVVLAGSWAELAPGQGALANRPRAVAVIMEPGCGCPEKSTAYRREAVWFGFGGPGLHLGLSIAARLGGRRAADRFEQAAGVEPIDPFEGGERDRPEGSPRPMIVSANDRLGQ